MKFLKWLWQFVQGVGFVFLLSFMLFMTYVAGYGSKTSKQNEKLMQCQAELTMTQWEASK